MPNTPNFFAIQDPVFAPAMRNILSITQSYPTTITTTYDGVNPGEHDYISGLIVRLIVPSGFGMIQANELSGPITVINSTQFTMPIDTTNFDPFIIPALQPGYNATPAQVVVWGEINDILTGAVQNILPPQV